MTLRERIEESLDTVRPMLRVDGGDVEMVEYDETEGELRVRLLGACGACPISSVTMEQGIARRVRTMVPEVRTVRTI